METLLTVAEVAELWKVHTSYIYALARRGDLAHVRLGRHAIRFRAADVQEYEDSRHQKRESVFLELSKI